MEEVFKLLGIFIAISSPIWIIVLICLVMKHKTRTAELRASHMSTKTNDEVAELEESLSKLIDRVSVLEAIITDSGYQLQEKFKRL